MIEYLMYFGVAVVCSINLIWIFGKFTNEKFQWSLRNILLVLIIDIFQTYIYSLRIVPLKTFVSIVSIVFLNKKIYSSIKNHDILATSLFIWFLGMIFDIGVAYIYSILPRSFLIGVDSYIIVFILSLIMQLIYNILSRFKFLKVLSNYFNKVLTKVKRHYFVLFGLFVTIIFLGALAVNNLDDAIDLILIFSLAIALFIVGILYSSNLYQKLILNETIRLLLKNNKFYSDLNIETRQFKHNLVHKLAGVKSYGNNNVKCLIDEIILECQLLTKNNKELDKLPLGLDGFIYQKVYQTDFKTLNIAVDNLLNKDLLDVIKPKTYNKLCEVLGVVLDNSIDAALSSNEKLLYINIEETEKGVELFLKNTFSAGLDLDKLGTLDYTTKGRNHGIGLFSIFSIKSIKTEIKVVNNLFETRIFISKIKNKGET